MAFKHQYSNTQGFSETVGHTT